MDKITFWTDRDKGLIDPLLLSDTAEELAREIAMENKTNRKHNKRTQLRKFYDEVVNLSMQASALDENSDNEESNRKWNAIHALVNMIVAKAAYAKGRELISTNFLNFIKNGVSEIEESKDLKLFKTFFESFMGFYRLYGPRS